MTLRRIFCGSALAWLAACARVDPRHLTLSASEVQTLVARQFPRQQRLMELLDVSLANPLVRLVPERNRLATTMDLSLRFEPSDATVRLDNVKVEGMTLELAGTPLSGQAARLAALLAERVLDDFVIYRVSDERRQAMARAGVNNADVAVTERGIELRFAATR